MNTIEKTGAYVLNTYKRYPLSFSHGKGMYLYTENGDKYLDMASGIAVSSLGHAHSKIINAVNSQVKKLIHTSNLFYTQPYADLAEKLIKNSIFNKVFFCNSGAEANEGALKIAKKYGNTKSKNKKSEIVSMKNSFHGRTIATISITGQEKYQKGFEPLLPGVKFAEYNNYKDLKSKISSKTCAVIIEPIQGEGGILQADTEFILAARDLCDKYDALLIFDEVQTGVGRTGKLFAYEYFSPAEPDILTTAKGLAGGFPIGAILVSEKYASVLSPGDHASTFGGNPVSCAAANAVLDTILEKNFLININIACQYFRNKLQELKEKYKQIKDVRGIGLLNGIEINFEADKLINKLIDHKILAVPAGKSVVRFVPPLIVKEKNFDTVIDALNNILKDEK